MVSDSTSAAKVPEQMVIIREDVNESLETATFAGGCFWCTEAILQETPGVIHAISGYAGGEEFNPTYEDVYTESTGHREAVRVYYDSTVVSYPQLLDIYWRSTDPVDAGGQFVDRGFSYTTAVFYENDSQKAAAEEYKVNLDKSGKFKTAIVTQILPFSTFYEAEEYHQDFYIKSTDRYKEYANNSGRNEFRQRIWENIMKEEATR